MNRSDEPRSALAVGMEWASRVTTVGLEFAGPPVLGAWADRSLGTSSYSPFLLVGAVLGFAVGMAHILRFAREADPGPRGGGPKSA